MSETKKQLFDILRDIKDGAVAIAPGLKNIGHDIVGEGKAKFEHGSMELVSAIGTGNAFVQYSPTAEREEHSQEHSDDHSHDQSHEMHLERDGHER